MRHAHVRTCAYKREDIRLRNTHVRMRKETHTRMRKEARVRAHTHAPTHTHNSDSARAQKHMHTHARTRTHTHAHARTHTHARTHARTHANAHARTHMLPLSLSPARNTCRQPSLNPKPSAPHTCRQTSRAGIDKRGPQRLCCRCRARTHTRRSMPRRCTEDTPDTRKGWGFRVSGFGFRV